MKISKYDKWLKVSEEENMYALFNNFLMQIVFVDEESLQNILNFKSNEDVEKLKELGIYVEDESSLDEIYNELKDTIKSQSKQLSIMYLNISTFCNLACKYCFIENNPISKNKCQKMTFETAKIAVDKFIKEIKKMDSKDTQIIIYGGEPLTNYDVFEKIVEYIRKKDANLPITTITNGTLLTDEHIKILKKNKVGLGISLDGPKFINDKNRVYRNENKSVYDDAIKSIKKLNDNDCNYCVSATVTKDVVDNYDEIYKWIKDSKIRNVFWNLYHYSSKTNEWEKFYPNMSEFILNMYNDLDKINVGEERVKEQLKLFLEQRFKFHNCGAVGLNQITVQPNGDVCICQGDSKSSNTIVGNIVKDELSDMLGNPKNKEWLEMYTIDKEECRYCEAVAVCGGGCPLQAEALFGSRKALDKATCIYYKNSLEWLLKEYYKCYKENDLSE